MFSVNLFTSNIVINIENCLNCRGVIRVQNETYHIQPLQMQEIEDDNIVSR